MHKKFFLVPLQVHIDSQVTNHSCFRSVEAFLRHVVSSFAQHAPEDRFLVIKHHPMDRGYTDYKRMIAALGRESGLADRLIYVHDIHLPTLLRNACGVVTINSTVGLSALYHDTPVKTLGESVYDVPGVVSTLSLPDFWVDPGVVNKDLYRRFKHYMIQQTQINCGFYAPKAMDL
jgi:capsular polysaccharide export protein